MKRSVIIAGGVILVVVLAGAAYLTARLLFPGARMSMDEYGRRTLELAYDMGAGVERYKVHIDPNPALPRRPMDVNGLFLRREDNTIIVGAGEIEVRMMADDVTGEVETALNHSGPEVEVVLTHETILYREDTEIPGPGSGKGNKEITIVQEITPIDSLEDISTTCEVQVWGRQQGDRVVAEVLVYHPFEAFTF